MSKFLSGRERELKIGISSYTDNDTVLEVIGNSNISGIATAAYFYGDGSNLTNLTIGGGTTGDIKILDDISSSFDGITTSFSLTSSSAAISPSNTQSLLINVGGVVQDPSDDYSISGSNIIFSTAPESGLTFSGIYFNFGIYGTIADGTVLPQMLSTGGPWWTTGGNLGIGTTIPTSALDVVGDAKISNDVYVDTIRRSTDNSTNTKIALDAGSLKFYAGNGVTPKLTLNGGVGINTNLNVTGILTASYFYGDGQYLTGIVSGVGIATEGGTVGSGATILDFRGAGISTVTVSSGIATINIVGGSGGGGASVSISTEAPSNPSEGDLWYNSILGRTFIYYSDDSSSQWVDSAPFNIPEPTSTPGKSSYTFTATEGQTEFTVSYTAGYIDVFLNGIRLNSAEYIATNGSTITLLQGATAGDVLDVVEYRMGIGDTGPAGPASALTIGTRSGVVTQNIAGIAFTVSLRSGIGTVSI